MFIPILSDTIKKKLLPYTLDFATHTFDAAWTAPNWAVSAGTAKNTPTEASSVTADGNMEAVGVDSWPAYSTPDTREKSGAQAHGGSQSLHIVNTSSTRGANQNVTLTTNAWYAMSVWTFRVAGTTQITSNWDATTHVIMQNSAVGSWAGVRLTGRAAGSPKTIFCVINGAGEGYYDDIYLNPLSALLAYRNFGAANVRVKAPWTIAANYQAGVVARYVDANNYLYAYHDRTNINLIQVQGGTTSPLVSVATAYSAGTNVEIWCNGATVQVAYGGVQKGTDQTVTGSLITATQHGLFSTDVSCTLPSVNVVRY